MAVPLLPEAVAYAGLVRRPVVRGLTATMVRLAIYAVFGGSHFPVVEPTSSTTILSAADVPKGVNPAVAEPPPSRRPCRSASMPASAAPGPPMRTARLRRHPLKISHRWTDPTPENN